MRKIRPYELYRNCGNRPGSLYRHFSKEGELLYVGISISAILRLKRHKNDSSWFREITRIEIEHFDYHGDARNAELLAIQTEHPKWNKAGVKKNKKEDKN